MKMSLASPLWLLLMVMAMTVADRAGAAQLAAVDRCQIYGFAPRTEAYALCRMNVRRYWTTGPCGYADFAFAHREYCHLNSPPFL
jgi:hypothetical protein